MFFGKMKKRGGGELRPCHQEVFFMPFKKKYFPFDNLSTYGHIMLKFFGRYFYWLVTIFFGNRAILVQKLGGEKQFPKPINTSKYEMDTL